MTDYDQLGTLRVARELREFIETETDDSGILEPGLQDFLQDPLLSGDATEQEVEFLKSLKLRGRRPAAIYYYRELQNLRDPLHFRPV